MTLSHTMGQAHPEGCTDYAAVRSDPQLARACADHFARQEPDWAALAAEIPWAKLAMEALVFLLL